MLERDVELRTLLAAFARAKHGQGSTVLISGEAGLGKTALLREFVTRIGSEARLFAGACDDLHTPRVLGPFRDMVQASGGALPPVSGQADTADFLDALLGQLAIAAQPAVIIVEDVHWADDASLDILRYLGRRVGELPAVLCASYRPEEVAVTDSLWRVLGALTGSSVTRLELRELSSTVVAEQAALAGLDPDHVVAAVGGNPFYLTEVIADPEATVPASVRDAIVTRMQVLPEQTRAAMELLAVVPNGAEWSLLEAVLDGGAVALAPAEQAGLVKAVANRFTYRHELARQAVEESLSAGRRRDLNQAVLVALGTAKADVSRLVHHAVRAEERHAVARHAPVAAIEAIEANAYREAAAFAELALDCADLIGDRREIARLHGQAAHALRMLNETRRAAHHADLAVTAWEAAGSPAVELGEALMTAAGTAQMIANPGRARALAERAAGLLEPLGPSHALAHAYSTLGNLDYVTIRFRSAEQWCERALAMADSLGYRDVAAHAHIYLGLATVMQGDEEGLAHLQNAVTIAEEIEHQEHLVRALSNYAAMLAWLGRHADAQPMTATALRIAHETNNATGAYHAAVVLSRVDLFQGRWDAAEARLNELLGNAGDPVGLLTPTLALLGRIHARRGDQAARELIGRSWRIAKDTRQLFRLAMAGAARLEFAWLEGDDRAVRTIGADLLAIAERGYLPYFRAEVLRYLKRVGMRVTGFDGCPAPYAAGIAGDWTAAAELWEGVGNRYEAALELLEAPDPEPALRGLRMLDDLGAVAAAAKQRRRLRERGIARIPRGPRMRTQQNPANLTNRQLEVLSLLADGLTGPEIADRLLVSRRTLEHHVSAILGKLGVYSRDEAVAAARRRGIVPAGQT